MTHFQDLLRIPGNSITPAEQQDHAARQLPQIVKKSHLKWWSDPSPVSKLGSFLVVLVAPYSHYDLAFLDLLDEELARRPVFHSPSTIPIYVANLLSYDTVEQLNEEFPIIQTPPLQTPLTIHFGNGAWIRSASGELGRDMAADAIGIPADELNRQIIDRLPAPYPI